MESVTSTALTPDPAHAVPAVELGFTEGDVGIGLEPTFLLHVTLCFLLTQRNRVSQEGGQPSNKGLDFRC